MDSVSIYTFLFMYVYLFLHAHYRKKTCSSIWQRDPSMGNLKIFHSWLHLVHSEDKNNYSSEEKFCAIGIAALWQAWFKRGCRQTWTRTEVGKLAETSYPFDDGVLTRMCMDLALPNLWQRAHQERVNPEVPGWWRQWASCPVRLLINQSETQNKAMVYSHDGYRTLFILSL